MNRIKKTLALLLAGVMVMAMSLTAFAASGVNAEEQKVLDAARAKASELGVADTKTFASYFSQATAYLVQDDVDLNSIQVEALVASVNSTADSIKAQIPAGSTLKDLKNVDAALLNQLVNQAVGSLSDAAALAGITVSVDGSGNITVGDGNGSNGGSVVAQPGSVIKQTGTSFNTTVMVIAVLVSVLAVCGIVAEKKNLFVTKNA